jgi:nitrogen fixation/metabolism regulation signal transduction histidine kinase
MSRVYADFDLPGGISLAAAVRDALVAEAAALERARGRADKSLAAARGLFLSAGGFGLFATLIMAVLLPHRLRQPLQQLETGLQAYGTGDFSYRFVRFRDTEFACLGRQLPSRPRRSSRRSELSRYMVQRRFPESRFSPILTVCVRCSPVFSTTPCAIPNPVARCP